DLVRQVSAVLAEEEPEDRQTPELGHVQEPRGGAEARAGSPGLQASRLSPRCSVNGWFLSSPWIGRIQPRTRRSSSDFSRLASACPLQFRLCREDLTMSSTRTVSMVLAGVFAMAATGHAYVKGGGPAKTDCFTAWQVTSPTVTANRGPTGVDCQDGDPTCDADGQGNGVCSFGVSLCPGVGTTPQGTP